jgi:hypothetical protein
MNCHRSLGRWDRGFESHLWHGCLVCVRAYSVCVVLCLGSGLSKDWSLVKGVLPSVKKIITVLNKRPEPWKSRRAIEKKNLLPWSLLEPSLYWLQSDSCTNISFCRTHNPMGILSLTLPHPPLCTIFTPLLLPFPLEPLPILHKYQLKKKNTMLTWDAYDYRSDV